MKPTIALLTMIWPWLLWSQSSLADNLRQLTVYQSAPPFVVDRGKKQGLAFDLARYINAQQDQYNFEVVVMPRKRVNHLLNVSEPMILLFSSPRWEGENALKRYLWTATIVADNKYIISAMSKKVEYQNLDSLVGYTFGKIRGYNYKSLQPYINDGRIGIDVSPSEFVTIEKIKLGWIDVAESSMSILRYYQMLDSELDRNVYVPKKNYYQVNRRILVTRDQQAEYDVIAPIIDQSSSDDKWHAILKTYFGGHYKEFIR